MAFIFLFFSFGELTLEEKKVAIFMNGPMEEPRRKANWSLVYSK